VVEAIGREGESMKMRWKTMKVREKKEKCPSRSRKNRELKRRSIASNNAVFR
jgi:hypothetical protein